MRDESWEFDDKGIRANKPNFIVVWELPFTEFDWRRLQLAEISRFAKVTVFDCSLIWNSHFRTAYSTTALRSEIRSPTTELELSSELREILRSSHPCVVWSQVRPESSLGRLVAKFRRKFGFIQMFGYLGGVPISKTPYLEAGRSYPDFIRGAGLAARRLLLRHRMADVALVAGRVLTQIASEREGRAILIGANSFDLEMWEGADFESRESSQKIGVFIDTGFPKFPTDSLMYGKNHEIDTETWYARLRALFDRVERLTDLDVVIALHPKHHGRNTFGIFGDRRVADKPTSNLIRHAEFVMTFGSTAMSFAVLKGIPIMLLSSSQFESDRYLASLPSTYGSAIGKSPLNIDHGFSDSQILASLTVSSGHYGEYKRDYLTSSESPKTNSQAMLELIMFPLNFEVGQCGDVFLIGRFRILARHLARRRVLRTLKARFGRKPKGKPKHPELAAINRKEFL